MNRLNRLIGRPSLSKAWLTSLFVHASILFVASYWWSIPIHRFFVSGQRNAAYTQTTFSPSYFYETSEPLELEPVPLEIEVVDISPPLDNPEPPLTIELPLEQPESLQTVEWNLPQLEEQAVPTPEHVEVPVTPAPPAASAKPTVAVDVKKFQELLTQMIDQAQQLAQSIDKPTLEEPPKESPAQPLSEEKEVTLEPEPQPKPIEQAQVAAATPAKTTLPPKRQPTSLNRDDLLAHARERLQRIRKSIRKKAQVQKTKEATPPAPEPVAASQAAVAAEQTAGLDDKTPPDFSQNLPPAYPRQAIQDQLEGTVLLRLHVTDTGQIERVEVIESSGHAVLDQAAVEAVRQWQGQPAQQNGLPVATIERLPIRFRL